MLLRGPAPGAVGSQARGQQHRPGVTLPPRAPLAVLPPGHSTARQQLLLSCLPACLPAGLPSHQFSGCSSCGAAPRQTARACVAAASAASATAAGVQQDTEHSGLSDTDAQAQEAAAEKAALERMLMVGCLRWLHAVPCGVQCAACVPSSARVRTSSVRSPCMVCSVVCVCVFACVCVCVCVCVVCARTGQEPEGSPPPAPFRPL